MSELSAIYLRVNISEKRFNDWLKSPLKQALDYNDWETMNSQWESGWENDFCCLNSTTPQEFLELWSSEETCETRMFWEYDKNANHFLLAQPFFSENLISMAITLAVLRSIAEFKDVDNTNYAIIFHYFWNQSRIDALLKITCDKSLFLAPYDKNVPKDFKNEANFRLDQLMD